jgi:hypothetical protein
MNVGGIILQAVFSAILWLAPATILKSDGLKISRVLTFIAIFGMCHVGGLILATPLTLVLCVYFVWVCFVGHATGGTKRVLFLATITLSAIYLTVQILHLPIRFALGQPTTLIAANIAGILAALSMLAAPTELLIARKNGWGGVNGTDSLSDELIENAFVEEGGVIVGTVLVERPAEICPYCEQRVVPDADGRCTACHRPIG